MSIDLDALRDGIQEWAEQVAEEAARQALDTVRPGVPVGSSSTRGGGELKASEFDHTSGTQIDIGYDAEHASYTDEGTAPHAIPTPVAFHWDNQGIDIVITPNFAKGMEGRVARFETGDGTVVVMGKSEVNHPGTERQGWWTDVIGEDGSYSGLMDIVQDVADTITISV